MAWAVAQTREAQTREAQTKGLVSEGEDFRVKFHATDSVPGLPHTFIRFWGSLQASECLSATDFTSGDLWM